MGLSLTDYCNLIPNYALYFYFIKSEKEIYHILFNNHRDDLFQTIALVLIQHEGKLDINSILKKEIYKLVTRITDYRKDKKDGKIVDSKKYYLSKTIRKCDICNKHTNHYMYKSLIPGKDVCRICRNRIVRQDKKRNKL